MESADTQEAAPPVNMAADGALETPHADVDAQDEDGWTATHAAVKAGEMETLIHLVAHGAELGVVTKKGDSLVHVAASANNVAAIEYLVKQRGMEVDLRNEIGRTPLHHAATGGCVDAVRVLLQCGAQLEAQDQNDQTPLFRAAVNGRGPCVLLLLNDGADVNAAARNGWLPIHGAALSGDVETIQLLVERGSPLKSLTEGERSVVHIAAANGSLDAVRYFSANGLNIDARDADGQSPLFQAAVRGHRSTVEFLLEKGADVNAVDTSGWVPLHGAAQSGDVETIKVLVEHGADLSRLTKDKWSMLHIAAAKGSLDAVTFFTANGLDVDASDSEEQTPLLRAIVMGHRAVVEFLLDQGASVNIGERDGWAPIHSAVQSGDVKLIELLLERGADLHSLDKVGRSALHAAAGTGSQEVIELLVRHGANAETQDINKPDEGGSAALHYAALKGETKTMKFLLEMGADILAVDKTGWSPLHYAAQGGSADAIELLLREGADINAKDKDGTSVLHVALAHGNDAVALDLLREGADTNAIDESNDWTALLFAAHGGSVELLKLLIEKSQEVNAVAKDRKTALHVACSQAKRDAVEYLIGLGMDVSAMDEDKMTPLHDAAEAKASECIVSLLLAVSKAFIDEPDKDGLRPLHFTAKGLFEQGTRELLTAGADVHALTNIGESPLQLAVFAESGSSAALSTVLTLCRFGAQWTAKCQEKLMETSAQVEASEVDAVDERYQDLQWCRGLRACILHWEKQIRDGTKALIKVPREVVQRGDVSVKTYLADATSSSADELMYRCKVCVVGPSQWGKSSLVRSIETMKPFLMDAKDRTIGIDLVSTSLAEGRATMQVPAESSERAAASITSAETRKRHEVTFWDFAGQDVYQVAHSLFFSRRTVYVVVVDVKTYLDQLKAMELQRPAAVEASMDRFLSRYVFRWVRMIFARQPDAEFIVLGTKAYLLENEDEESAQVWRDLQSRIYQWKLNYIREIEKELGGSKANAGVGELREKLARLGSDKWLVVSVTRLDSIDAVCLALRRAIEEGERGFPMWNKYSRVVEAIAAKRAAANRPGDGQHRIRHGMVLFRRLRLELIDEVEGLEFDECREILRTLHDSGDVIWYEHEETGQLRDFIILDPMLVIDIVREVISHEHAALNDASEETPRIDGRVSHALLETFPLWKHMDKELMYAFKMLLKQFQLAYPADDEVMQPESDLIVPSYWKVQLEAAGGSNPVVETATEAPVPLGCEEGSLVSRHCWEYEVSADLADAIFEQFAVQSYTSFMKREVRANCIESSCPEFKSRITLHPGEAKHDAIRVEVASESVDIAWLNMRYYLMKLEKVLDAYSGLAVPRYVVVDDERHSLSPATKAVRDSIMMGRAVDDLRVQIPWLPPDLDWFINQAWRDIAAFQELQMMHLVRDKLTVLQKLVVTDNSQRRYPAMWTLEYEAETHVVVLRMLSDLSGRCYHVPIEIAVPPTFLAKHGSKIKEGVSLLANVVPSSLPNFQPTPDPRKTANRKWRV